MIGAFLAVVFFRGNWKEKFLCLPCGALIMNGFILCRSRGGVIAALMGAGASVLFARPDIRRKVLVGLVLAAIGLLVLSDPSFWTKAKSISFDTARLDRAASSRLQAWKVAVQIVSDHPFGISDGNFKKTVGLYNPELAGGDP